jgi:hypothetical protein
MKKDDYLSTIMQIPPKQRIKITPFDIKTQREAFTVSLEGLKGVCLSNPLHEFSDELMLLSSRLLYSGILTRWSLNRPRPGRTVRKEFVFHIIR